MNIINQEAKQPLPSCTCKGATKLTNKCSTKDTLKGTFKGTFIGSIPPAINRLKLAGKEITTTKDSMSSADTFNFKTSDSRKTFDLHNDATYFFATNPPRLISEFKKESNCAFNGLTKPSAISDRSEIPGFACTTQLPINFIWVGSTIPDRYVKNIIDWAEAYPERRTILWIDFVKPFNNDSNETSILAVSHTENMCQMVRHFGKQRGCIDNSVIINIPFKVIDDSMSDCSWIDGSALTFDREMFKYN